MFSRNSRHARGHLLLELALTAAIITLITTAGLPISIQAVRWLKLRSAAYELSRELQRARLQALAENSSIRMEVTLPERRYQMVAAVEVNSPRGAPHILAQGISFASLPARAIIFHPWGTASPAGSYILSGAAGRLRVLVHLTGRVRIEEVP